MIVWQSLERNYCIKLSRNYEENNKKEKLNLTDFLFRIYEIVKTKEWIVKSVRVALMLFYMSTFWFLYLLYQWKWYRVMFIYICIF